MRSSRFLAAAQDPDGGFRSANYAAFRDGYSLTPLAVLALWFAPPPAQTAVAVARGANFLATLVDARMALRSDAAAPRYPLYAIAGAVLVLNLPGQERHRPVRDALVAALRQRQMSEARGFTGDDVSLGGWSYDPGLPVGGAAADRVHTANLSATLFAVGALRLAGVPQGDPALRSALRFVERCHNHAPEHSTPHDDGGFFFSPGYPDANKAGPAGLDPAGRQRFRSYGSMTADGLRALLELGVPHHDVRVRAAAHWLTRHFDPARNPGSFAPGQELRRDSAYFYYAWSVAHALRALGTPTLETDRGPVDWARALAEELLRRQRSDGAWANRYTEMREDEPIVATSFAHAALAVAASVLAAEYRSHRSPGAVPAGSPAR